MKVLILASWFPKNAKDNTGRFILNQSNALSRAGVDVKIVDCTIRLPLISKQMQILWQSFMIKLKLKLEGWSPDVIHAHVAFPAGKIAVNINRQIKAKLVLTEHCGPPQLLEKYFPSGKDLYAFYNEFDAVVCVSKSLARDIFQETRAKIIGNIIDSSFLSTELVAPHQKRSVALISPLEESKGIVEFIDSLKILDEKIDDKAYLHVLGVGTLKIDFPKFRNIELYFYETGGYEQVRRVINESSLLILPSRYETFSMVAAEAMALGRKVIGFDCGGPTDFVKEGMGVLLKDRKPQELADLIRILLDETMTPEQMSARREIIEKKYSESKIAVQLLDLYKGLFETS